VFNDPARALDRAETMVAEGAAVIDVGGESTRPGALPVPLEEELRRVVPVVERLGRSLRVPISVDTSKAVVAQRALEAGAAIVNDVTALRGDPGMAEVVAAAGASVVLMHMRGTPQTMQQHADYADVVAEVVEDLRERVDAAVASGIVRERILVDPGIGFAKTAEQSVTLLAHLDRLAVLDCPVFVGPSRKSFIGAVLDLPVEQRLLGTAAAVAVAAWLGADLVRVHDVGAMRQVMRLTAALRASRWSGGACVDHG
jgi:dihydropteroate synthase